jgi:hypothetical protein
MEKVSLTELDPCCSELLVLFQTNSLETLAPPIGVMINQFLDDPQESVPLKHLTSLKSLSKALRFGFGGVPSDSIGHYRTLASVTDWPYEWDSTWADNQDLAPWDPACSNSLQALVYGSYDRWACLIPMLKLVTPVQLFTALFWNNLFKKVDLIFPVMDIFSYEPDKVKNGQGDYVQYVVGKKDYIIFGDLLMERGFWNIYWHSVVARYPRLAQFPPWSLKFTMDAKEEPLPIHVIKLQYQVDSDRRKNFTITFPEDFSIWGAIAAAFINAPITDRVKTVSVFSGPHWVVSHSSPNVDPVDSD